MLNFLEKTYQIIKIIICDYLENGAPIGFQGCLNVSEIDIKNHKGASEFSSDTYKYLRKEASYDSIIGPLESNPFDCQFKISPLNSVTKKDSSERTVILDLSFYLFPKYYYIYPFSFNY